MSRPALCYTILCLATLVVLGRVAGNGYVIWDDQLNVYENPIFTGEQDGGVLAFWKQSYEGLYIPVTYTAWSMVHAFAGDDYLQREISLEPIIDPRPFHVANLLFHLGSVILVYELLRRLLDGAHGPAPLFGALLFAFHPLQVESVAWVTGLKDVLSTFIGLACVSLFLANSRRQFAEPGTGRPFSGALYWLSLVLFALGLLSKPGLVTLPFVIFVLDATIQKSPWKKTAAALVPFLILVPLIVFITARAQMAPTDGGIIPDVANIPFHLRPIVALDSLTFYLGKLIYPVGLAVQYDRSPSQVLEIARAYPFWAVPIVLAALLLVAARSQPRYLAGFVVAVFLLAPVLGFVPFGFQRVSTIADRYFYFAMFGIAMAAATWIAARKSPVTKFAVPAAALVVFAVLAFRQTAVWEGPSSLFAQTHRVNPRSVAAAYNLGAAALNRGDYAAALPHYRRLLTINPDQSNGFNIVGFLYNGMERPKEAIPYLERAIKLKPEHPHAHRNLGISRFKLGELETALALFEHSDRVNPDSVETQINLAATLLNLDRLDEAAERFSRAAAMEPGLWQPHKGLASVLLEQGRFAEAVRVCTRLTELRPDNVDALMLLAQAYDGNGNLKGALSAVQRAVDLSRAQQGVDEETRRQLEQVLGEYRSRLPR